MKNKLTALILCVALLSSVFCILSSSASAIDGGVAATAPSAVPSSSMQEQEELASKVNMTELEKVLRKGFSSCKKKIDISKFKLDVKYIDAVAEFIRDEMYDMFHVNTETMQFYYYTDTNRMVEVEVEYIFTAKQQQEGLQKCKNAVEKLVRGIKGNSKLSEVEKALLLHDRLALYCEYDYANFIADKSKYNVYTIYGVFVDRVAVCQGYSVAYKMLLNEVGIDSYVVNSVKLDHAWNIVYIGGKPYHVDVTWDDAVWDMNGRVNHDNFLRSNAGIVESGHTANDYDTPAKYSTYENMYWKDYTSAFTLVGNEIYYVEQTAGSKTAKIRRLSDNAVIADVSFAWPAENYGTGYTWNDNYTRLATDGTYLYYNSPDSIYRLDVKTKKSTKIYTPNLSYYYAYHIFGFNYDNGFLIYDIEDTPDFDAYTLVDNKFAYVVVSKGDVNGNGKIDAQDYALAKRHCLKTLTLNPEQITRGDINGNGKIDASEYSLIKRHCLGTYTI